MKSSSAHTLMPSCSSSMTPFSALVGPSQVGRSLLSLAFASADFAVSGGSSTSTKAVSRHPLRPFSWQKIAALLRHPTSSSRIWRVLAVSLLVLLLRQLYQKSKTKTAPVQGTAACCGHRCQQDADEAEAEEGEEEDDEGVLSPQQQQQQQQQSKQKQQPASASAKAKPQQQQHRQKGASRLEWWQRLNLIKPALVIPAPRVAAGGGGRSQGRIEDEAIAAVHTRVVQLAEDRLQRGRDWLVRDSDYGPAPTHGAIKAQVNAAIVKTVENLCDGESLESILSADPRNIILLLDTPLYGTTTALCELWADLRYSQQVVIPQADLGHYFEMLRGNDFYVGVRAQRLDHWLCANSGFGFRCLLAFLDYECRLAGSLSARLCPAADIMRYFRWGLPMEPASVLAITVGLEEPASTVEEVDAFVRGEASLNGYEAELVQSWKYRMATLLYIVRKARDPAEMIGEMSGL